MSRCIVKIIGNSATSFAACFYNEKKVAQGTAKCLAMRNFGELERYFIHSPVVMSKYLKKIADHNSMVKHPQKHIVFSYPGKATQEEVEQLLKDAAETLDRLGYKGQPQTFWVHNDTENTHIHAASVTVSVKNGMWIDNYMEGRRARRILDQLRGINIENAINKILEYKFESREQFKSLLIAAGYKPHYDDENKTFDIWRNKELVGSISQDEIDDRIAATGRNRDNHQDIVKNLRGVLLDRRRRSLKISFGGNEPEKIKTKGGREHTATKKLKEVKDNRFNGDKGLDIEGDRKAQFKQFLLDLKRELGISIVFSQWKDGSTKGYTLIDNRNKLVFKGSDIVDLQKLLNPEWRKGQVKDAGLSADDAAAMAEEIRLDDNLPLAIEQQLERLGIDIIYSKDSAMALYKNDGEDENRQKARFLMNQVLTMVRSEEDATEDGLWKIKSYAKEAMGRAVCADDLHALEEKHKAKEKAAEEARRTEQEKVRQRAETAKNITGDNIGRFITDVLDDYNIIYDHGAKDYRTDISEERAVKQSLASLEKAISSQDPVQKGCNADLAHYYARCAEAIHRKNLKQNTSPVETSKPGAFQRPAERTVPEEPKCNGAKIIPFVNIEVWGARDRDGNIHIGIVIDGKKYSPKPLLPIHQEWYQEQANQKQAMQDLLIHYFGDEIQQAQVENWKQQHFDAGKMPFGIVIGATYGTIGRMGDKFWLRGEFTQNDETKLESKEVSKDDYIKWRNGGDDARAVVCNTIGRDLIKGWGFNPLSDIKKMLFDSFDAFDTAQGIEQSVHTFEAFTEQLCNDFIAACGNVALAYLGGLGGDGRGDAGGGGNNDLSKKKDDEWWKRGSSIMGFHPKKKGSSGGRKV